MNCSFIIPAYNEEAYLPKTIESLRQSILQSGIIETFIVRSSRNRQLMDVSFTKGKRAKTNYKTIKIFEGKNIPTLSLVECRLETGRTH